jgi:hypothetical protein
LINECEDENSVADAYGDTCESWYDFYPNDCGTYDTDDFIATTACCACKDDVNILDKLQLLYKYDLFYEIIDYSCNLYDFCPTDEGSDYDENHVG